MRRLLGLIMTTICIMSLCACSKSTDNENAKSWDCTVTCADESSDNAYVISYSSEKIVSTKGVLTIENRNDFDVVIHLFANGKERVEEIVAGGVTILYQITKDTEYTLGCHADVSEGTDIKLIVYDGEGNIMHLEEEGEVKSFASTLGWSTQEIESLFLDNAERDWKLIKCVSVYDFAYDRVGAILYTEDDTEYVNVAFIDEDGIMPHCGIEATLDEKIEFTYHGNGEVTFNVCSKDGVKYKQKIVFSKHVDEVNFVSESLEY